MDKSYRALITSGLKLSNCRQHILNRAPLSDFEVDLLSRWRALRGFRKTLEDDHD